MIVHDNKRLKYVSFFYYTHVNKPKISNNAQSAKHKTDSDSAKTDSAKKLTLTQQNALSATRRALSAKKVTQQKLGNDGPLPALRPTPGPRARAMG